MTPNATASLSPPSSSDTANANGHYHFPQGARAKIHVALAPDVLVPTRKRLPPTAFAPPARCTHLTHLADPTHERALVDAYAKRTAALAEEERAHQDRINRVAVTDKDKDKSKSKEPQSSSDTKELSNKEVDKNLELQTSSNTSATPINYAEFEAPQAPLDPWDAAEAANNTSDNGRQDWQALQRVMMGHSAPVQRLGAGSQLVSTSSPPAAAAGPKSPTVPPRPDPNRVAAVLNQVGTAAGPVTSHASGNSGGAGGHKPNAAFPGTFPSITPQQSYATIPGGMPSPPNATSMPMVPLAMPTVHNPHPHIHPHQPPGTVPMHMPMPVPGGSGFPHSLPRPGSNPNVAIMPGATPPLPPRHPLFPGGPHTNTGGTTPPPVPGIGSPGQNRRPNKAPPPAPASTTSPSSPGNRPSPRDLPPQLHPMFYSLLDMGFTADAVLLALHVFGDNTKRVTDFCLLYPSLATPLPARPALTTAVHTLYNACHPGEPDPDTLRAHIGAFARILDMGFAPDAAATALVVAKGNEQEAVETLMGS